MSLSIGDYLERIGNSQSISLRFYLYRKFLCALCSNHYPSADLIEHQQAIFNFFHLKFANLQYEDVELDLCLRCVNSILVKLGPSASVLTQSLYRHFYAQVRAILVNDHAPGSIRKHAATFVTLGMFISKRGLVNRGTILLDISKIVFKLDTNQSCFKAHLLRLVCILLSGEPLKQFNLFYEDFREHLLQCLRKNGMMEDLCTAAAETLGFMVERLRLYDSGYIFQGNDLLNSQILFQLEHLSNKFEYEQHTFVRVYNSLSANQFLRDQVQLESGDELPIASFESLVLYRIFADILGSDGFEAQCGENRFMRILFQI